MINKLLGTLLSMIKWTLIAIGIVIGGGFIGFMIYVFLMKFEYIGAILMMLFALFLAYLDKRKERITNGNIKCREIKEIFQRRTRNR